MKTQEEILSKIKELENDIKPIKNIMENSTNYKMKIDYLKSIFKIQREIDLLNWVLER
ncbi:hypothetical protein ABVN58_05720 [Fusobacterium polymorphum]|jgi:hypothetical protein|uniref:Uncharacterized protein n=1 Tax=Fusobacterium nucleatum CTI-6 TaxID=1316587 RepID=U7TW49_FUSNU|nr:hypothetical protein [Fusobacterium nucleatum]ERT47671.1 hypothetical protein HMPREF1767_01232 [Fusobacterium nucleatum CTI-6]DAT02194.1 MAG TPA: hypothetical protein [Bacteriophage sp.]